MATVDFSNLSVDSGTFNLEFDSFQSSTNTFYAYETTAGHQVILIGTGIVTNGSNQPTSGTITSVLIDYGNNDPVEADITITGLNLNITDIATLSLGGDTPLWDLVLAGNTTVIGSDNHVYTLGGDFEASSDQEIRYGGNDTMDTGLFGTGLIAGDAISVETGVLFGGDDTITGSGGFVSGDVYQLDNGGRVFGGDDVITFESDPTASGQVIISGDVTNLRGGSTFFGGDDILDASSFQSTENFSWFMIGDSLNVQEDGTFFVGGDDTIYAPEFGGLIYGDTRSIAFGEPHFVGGNDTLYGGAGDDSLLGDTGPADMSLEPSYTGGDDFVYGGGGDDNMWGGGGDDMLYGGTGKESMLGELGSDKLFGGNGSDSMFGGLGKDDVKGGKGKDYLDGAEGKDTLSGGSGNDTMYGRNGEDKLFGGSGKDSLYGGDGDDELKGGSKADDFFFFIDSDKDIITDFQNNTDTIVLDSALWSGTRTVEQVLADFG